MEERSKTFKLKEFFADNNFEFHEIGRKFSKRVESTVGKGKVAHENGRKFSKRVENTVGKGEIAR